MTSQDRDDFTEFVRARSGNLLHFAFWMTGNWEDAKDAVQETLARAFVMWARIEMPDAYTHRMVINTVRRSYRSRSREILVADPPDSGIADSASEALAARILLAGALRRLPGRQRAVVVLRYCLDMSVEDVAGVMRTTPGTVKSQASKALAKLGQDLELGGSEMPSALRKEGSR